MLMLLLPRVVEGAIAEERALMGLGALAGLSIGSALAQGIDRNVQDRLLALTRHFQSYLSTLSDEHLRDLSELVDEALEMVSQSSIASTR